MGILLNGAAQPSENVYLPFKTVSVVPQFGCIFETDDLTMPTAHFDVEIILGKCSFVQSKNTYFEAGQ